MVETPTARAGDPDRGWETRNVSTSVIADDEQERRASPEAARLNDITVPPCGRWSW
jgi:hypothetical protein